jgi:dCTP diphosphatase
MSDIKTLTNKIKQFRDKRNWLQFHNPKDMAISIAIEAAELLEQFQWQDKKEIEQYYQTHKEDISDEIADIAIYLFELSDNLGIDLSEAITNKMIKNTIRYPVTTAKGNHKKSSKL